MNEEPKPSKKKNLIIAAVVIIFLLLAYRNDIGMACATAPIPVTEETAIRLVKGYLDEISVNRYQLNKIIKESKWDAVQDSTGGTWWHVTVYPWDDSGIFAPDPVASAVHYSWAIYPERNNEIIPIGQITEEYVEPLLRGWASMEQLRYDLLPDSYWTK